jgi:tetratricopeptide (TPR) repeat protein
MFRRCRACLTRVAAHPWIVGLVLLLLAAAGIIGGPHLYAYLHFRAGRSALEKYHNDKAREHLDKCLSVWPGSDTAHLLASRAARRAGEFEAADRHLRECQHLRKGPSDETALEWALLHASMGDLNEVEKFLEDQWRANSAQAPLIWEALIQGYLRVYRILDALARVDLWLQFDADNIRALTLRGDIHWQINATLKAIADYRTVIERDPEQDEVRWRLARGLLDTSQYPEALKHLEQVKRKKPNDPGVLVRLARCQNMLGKRTEARDLLASVLAKNPDDGLALRTRGQISLMDGELDDAEVDLRRAVRVMPFDQPSLWSLSDTLKQQKKTSEAGTFIARAEKLKEAQEKLAEVSKQKMSLHPNDPALHCEMGTLLIRLGHEEVGKRWLESALNLKGNYRPAHAALADYYRTQGNFEKAEEHQPQVRER